MLKAVLLLSAVCRASDIRGVAPEDQHLYKPDEDGYFHCLSDPSIKIPFDRVNDDYCDCPDGSDEPGTSACNNGKFYCVGSKQYIPSRYVADGACDYELCCDGSDEAPGVCEDKCAEVLAKQEAEREKHRQYLLAGSQLRARMVEQAGRREKEVKEGIVELRTRIKQLKPKLSGLDAEVAQFAEDARRNSENSPASEPLKLVRESLRDADQQMQTLYDQASAYREAYNELYSALSKMSVDYNPNFNDPAVKEAIKRWSNTERPNPYLVGARTFSNDDALEQIEQATLGTGCEDVVDIKALAGGLKSYVKNVYATLVSQFGNADQHPSASLISALTTNPFSSQYLKRSHSRVGGLHITRVTEERDELKEELEEAEKKLKLYERLSSLGTEFWGSDNIGRSAENLCVQTRKGDFRYDVCLFGTAVQVNGRNNVQLGKSTGLKQDGEGRFYIDFVNGDRCNNGVFRSLRLQLECGHNTEAFYVEEPEMCHYEVQARSPIGCRPLTSSDNSVNHDEL